MKFKVISRVEIDTFKPTEPHIVISICSPCEVPPKYPANSNRLGLLRLNFHDINKPLNGTMSKVLRPPNSLHSRMIVDFFKKHASKVDLVVCQCEAGICRSAAIAAGLSKRMGQDDSEFFKRYQPNSLLYTLILKEK